jgi:ComF family protein
VLRPTTSGRTPPGPQWEDEHVQTWQQYIEPMDRFDRHRWLARIPSTCRICARWATRPFCEDCVTSLGAPIARCLRCALPLQSTDHSPETASLGCDACASEPTLAELDRCVAAIDYAWPWSELIVAFKYHDEVGLAHPLAELILHAPWADPVLRAADWVMPIPISDARWKERGYNQAERLARSLLHGLKSAPTLMASDAAAQAGRRPQLRTQWLERTSSTAHQQGANRVQRLAQQRASMSVTPDGLRALGGSSVVLIDDVMTTGATLAAAAQALRTAGAAQVSAVVLARARWAAADPT